MQRSPRRRGTRARRLLAARLPVPKSTSPLLATLFTLRPPPRPRPVTTSHANTALPLCRVVALVWCGMGFLFLALPVQAPILIRLLRHNNEEGHSHPPEDISQRLNCPWRCVLVRFLTIARTDLPLCGVVAGAGCVRMGFPTLARRPGSHLNRVLRHNSEEAPPPKTSTFEPRCVCLSASCHY